MAGTALARPDSALVIEWIFRVETGYAALLLSAFVLPQWISYRAWIPCLALALAFATIHALRIGSRLRIPWPAAAYLGIYVISGLHGIGNQLNVIDAGRYFAPPVLAVAFAWAAPTETTRRRLILLGVGAVAIQLPIAAGQTVNILTDFGSDAWSQVDAVGGLLGSEQAGTLAMCGLFAAAIVLAAGYLRVIKLGWSLALGIPFVSLSLWSSMKAGYGFAPFMLGTLVVSAVVVREELISRRTLVVGAVLAVLAGPALYIGTDLVYPGANRDFQNLGTLKSQLNLDQERDARTRARAEGHKPEDTDPAAAGGTLTLLPNRWRQLELAVRYSTREGVATTLVGRGLGATTYKTEGVLSATGSTTDQITARVQRTRGVWVARLISETGYLGLLAFLGLLGWMIVLAWQNRARLAARNWDSAVVLALPALAALTLAAGFYMPALVVQPYASLLWPMIGVAIAIDTERRRRAPQP